MARYRGPRVKIVRRLGELPGLTSKVPNRTYPAGQHGPSAGMQKMSQYRVRLQEKQKLRFNYGVSESQLLKYVRKDKVKVIRLPVQSKNPIVIFFNVDKTSDIASGV